MKRNWSKRARHDKCCGMKKEAEVHQSAYNYGVQQMLRKYLKNLSEKFYENFLRPSKVHSP